MQQQLQEWENTKIEPSNVEKKTEDQAEEEEQQGNPWEWPIDQQRDWLEKTFKLSQSPLLKGQPELHKQAEEVLLN